MKMNKNVLIVVTLFFLGCASSPDLNSKHNKLVHQKHGDYQIEHLPLSQNWQTFQCREGSLKARYTDGSKKSVTLQLDRGSEFLLTRRPSYDPAIFENERLAFYLNEKEAVVGRPSSATLLLTGCQLR